ncbi:hypothetical protein [Pseudomonas mosselii]|uniref:hypothetical protein n=1 Tax=Pseudomonas mosselii TaxID=78327 RepID=UPI001E4CC7F5|nr:hypothetical protein [Pseudomonas mosselii]MCH7420023.1 hypothetical protein [Pseudomonas mosselii]MCL8303244.1 hypothetical protein [Pseudomonas mosselii]
MTTITCPHCMNQVPRGAHVCRGCHAEIHYGTPRWVVILCTILSVVGGWWAAKIVHTFITTNSTVLWVIFGIAFVMLALGSRKLCKRLYAERTIFRRFYRS